MILKLEQEHWEWIEFALHSLNHPLHQRFSGLEACRVLISRDELDLIIEAVSECRDQWEWDVDQEEGETKKELEGLESDIEMMDETIDFLKELVVAR